MVLSFWYIALHTHVMLDEESNKKRAFSTYSILVTTITKFINSMYKIIYSRKIIFHIFGIFSLVHSIRKDNLSNTYTEKR